MSTFPAGAVPFPRRLVADYERGSESRRRRWATFDARYYADACRRAAQHSHAGQLRILPDLMLAEVGRS
jgi:hypothetical protein